MKTIVLIDYNAVMIGTIQMIKFPIKFTIWGELVSF